MYTIFIYNNLCNAMENTLGKRKIMCEPPAHAMPATVHILSPICKGYVLKKPFSIILKNEYSCLRRN